MAKLNDIRMRKTLLLALLINSSFLLLAAPTGSLSGLFSISDSKQVHFSKGNLNYNPNTKEWKFANNQYECYGVDNSNSSTESNYWVDAFCWSSTNNEYGTSTNKRDQSTDNFVEWGIKIGEEWRTLSEDEWRYLLNRKKNVVSYVFATIVIRENDSINGLLLIPDEWNNSDIEITAGKKLKCNVSQWVTIENAGGVFLPAAGFCEAGTTSDYNSTGAYWTKTTTGTKIISIGWDSSMSLTYNNDDPITAMSVRLVYEVPSSTPTAIGQATEIAVYAENGRIYAEGESQIFDLFGRDVTRMNGSLNGIYIVKCGDKVQKVIVK